MGYKVKESLGKSESTYSDFAQRQMVCVIVNRAANNSWSSDIGRTKFTHV